MKTKPSYVVASTLNETCIYDLSSSIPQFLGKQLRLTECNGKLAHSRNFFKTLRKLYDSSTISKIVLPYTEAGGSESKTQILQNARAFGYNDVTLCSFETASAIRALRCANMCAENGDVVVFIFHQKEIICATILQFHDGCWIPFKHFMVPVTLHKNDLELFCHNLVLNAPSTSKLHHYIIGYSFNLFIHRKQFFENMFKENVRFFDFNEDDPEGLKGIFSGFLTKARILNGDKDLKKFDVATVCEWDFKVMCNGKDVKTFETCYRRLPFTESAEFDVTSGTNFEFYKRHFIDSSWIYNSSHPIATTSSSLSKIVLLEVDDNGIALLKVTEKSISGETKQEVSPSPKKPISIAVKAHTPSSSKSLHKIQTPAQFSQSVPAKGSAIFKEYIQIHFYKDAFSVYSVSGNERKVITNPNGNPRTPAYVCFHSEKPTVGEEAQKMAKDYPTYTAYDFIPFFGKELSQIKVNENWPFKLIASECGKLVDLKINTSRGVRKAPIKFLMIHLMKKIVKDHMKLPLTEAKVTFSDEIKFTNKGILKEAMKEAGIAYLE